MDTKSSEDILMGSGGKPALPVIPWPIYSAFSVSSSPHRPAECFLISLFISLTSSIVWHLSVAVVISHAINCICLSVITFILFSFPLCPVLPRFFGYCPFLWAIIPIFSSSPMTSILYCSIGISFNKILYNSLPLPHKKSTLLGKSDLLQNQG